MATDDIVAATRATPGITAKIRGTDFRPPRSRRNPHVQSVLASSGLRRWLGGRRRAAIERAATEHLLDCGEGVRLQGFHNRQQVREEARGLIVLLHGWEGSARSAYLLNTGARMLEEGFDVFRLNFRDHGDTHHLNPELFHSGRLDEVVGAVHAIQQQFAPVALALAGFSLGGNCSAWKSSTGITGSSADVRIVAGTVKSRRRSPAIE
jgi:predicted alpha/beta-fold hydrolase